MRTFRKLNGGVVAAITDPPDQHIFSESIWGNSRTCRTLILHFDNTKNNTSLTLRLLERTGHWKQSETKVVVVGGKPDVKDIFLHHSFRNTVHGIYLAVNPNLLITQNSRPRLRAQLPYKDQLFNLEGRQLKYISSRYFPYIDFPHDIDEIPVPIIPYDTVDVRLADTFAMKHNFTCSYYVCVITGRRRLTQLYPVRTLAHQSPIPAQKTHNIRSQCNKTLLPMPNNKYKPQQPTNNNINPEKESNGGGHPTTSLSTVSDHPHPLTRLSSHKQ
ncbi:hypothetical protein Pcinc_008866 [Petrolisthes cinctipes]|uniref:Uncharacterized protein n=1 Tax=Petrolisthes cinctipes TaxID=88211 RepID=A0AAE1G811_PETCI|nr:hypothetical protein Pcinc_008866 [Petrolisthes cinctipes]